MTKILIIEDNELNLDMLSRRLVRAGFEVVSATTASGIVERVRAEQPDLILMDLGLPDVDGFTATALVRAEPSFAQLPIVALTAHAMAEDRERAIAAGCDAFETKPVDFTGLLTKIRALLAPREMRHG